MLYDQRFLACGKSPKLNQLFLDPLSSVYTGETDTHTMTEPSES